MQLRRLIDALSRPAAYGGRGDVEVAQTHCSVVFLVGDEVFKVKKPVDLGFLDYSTLDARARMCSAEVELNRRLAPDVYLGVVPIRSRGGEIGPDRGGDARGEIVEWAVHMRRLPDDATLAAWLARGALTPAWVREVAQRLARFHAAARRGEDVSRYARFPVVAANCAQNFEQLAPSVGDVVDAALVQRVQAATNAALAAARPRIEARADRGVPCETHGDLRLDHVYLFPDRAPQADVVIVDCIEFDERFRHADPVADIAFLVMDLRVHGAHALAQVLVDAYLHAADDEDGRALLPLYVAYRATVRAKVECMRAREDEVPAEQRAQARDRAPAHLLLALAELSAPAQRPCLVLVGGLPGTGKSVLAGRLAAEGFAWVRADLVRKALAGLAPTERGTSAFGTGIYTRAWSDRTYAQCLARAEAALARGERVVVDATFLQAARRRPFAALAKRLGVPLQIMLCEAPQALVRARLAARTGDPSDADWAVYEAARRTVEPPTAHEGPVVHVDAAGTTEQTWAQAQQALRAAGLA